MQETWVRFLGWEVPLEKGTATHSSILPGEFHGLYSPWGCKELDMTEQLSLSDFYYCYVSSTSDHQALALGGWGPLVIEVSIHGHMTNISTQESEQVVGNTIQ